MTRRKIIITQMYEIEEGAGVWLTEQKNKLTRDEAIKIVTEALEDLMEWEKQEAARIAIDTLLGFKVDTFLGKTK